jgi:hypothetical protein
MQTTYVDIGLDKLRAELDELCEAQERLGWKAKHGTIERARYFARAEAYACAASLLAETAGDTVAAKELDDRHWCNFRRSVA